MQSRLGQQVNRVALLASAVTFGSGLVLLFRFHMEHGPSSEEALGIGRLAWQNIHRLAAVAVLASVLVHSACRLKPLGLRVVRVLCGTPMRHDAREILFYLMFTAVVATGFAVWLHAGGSPPLLGPAEAGRPTGARHHWIDVHNVSGVLAFFLTVNHVRRRWRPLVASRSSPSRR